MACPESRSRTALEAESVTLSLVSCLLLHSIQREHTSPPRPRAQLPSKAQGGGDRGWGAEASDAGPEQVGVQGVTSAPAGVSELSSVPDGACSGPARSPAGRWEETQVSRTPHAQHVVNGAPLEGDWPGAIPGRPGPSRGPQGPLCLLLPPPHCLSCFSPSSTPLTLASKLTLESPDTVLSWGLSTCSSPGACLALAKAALKGYLLRPLVNCSSPSPTSHTRASPPPPPPPALSAPLFHRL